MWVAVSALSYSLFTVFGKEVLEQLRPSDVLFWRFAIAVPISWFIVLVRARSRTGPNPLKVHWWPRFAMGILFGALALLAFAALDLMSGALYVVIIYTYPAMVACGSLLTGKTMPPHIWPALGVIVVGIALTVPEVVNGSGNSAVVGMLLTLGNAFLYASYILYSEKIVSSEDKSGSGDSFVAAAWGMLGSLVFAAVVIAVNRGVRVPHGVGHLGAMFGLATVSTVVAMTSFFLGVARLGPARAAVVASLEPVLALVWLVVVSHESLEVVQVFGAACVFAGVFWAQRTPDDSQVSGCTDRRIKTFG